jgi:hypothetical protein
VDLGGEGQAVLPFLSHLNQIGQTGSTPRHALAWTFHSRIVAQTSKSAVSQVSNLPAARALRRAADLEIGDTAGLETCATLVSRVRFKHPMK